MQLTVAGMFFTCSRQAVSKWERAEASPELLKTEDPVESINKVEEEKELKAGEKKLLQFLS